MDFLYIWNRTIIKYKSHLDYSLIFHNDNFSFEQIAYIISRMNYKNIV